jgi:hypothetical protein
MYHISKKKILRAPIPTDLKWISGEWMSRWWVCECVAILFSFYFFAALLCSSQFGGGGLFIFFKTKTIFFFLNYVNFNNQRIRNFFIWFVCVCACVLCLVRPFGDDSSMVVRSAKAGRWAWPSRTTTTGSSWATSPRTGTGTNSTRTLTSLHVSCSKNQKTNRYTIKS